MSKDFDTNKWPEDFKNIQSFMDYCVKVAEYIYKIFYPNSK